MELPNSKLTATEKGVTGECSRPVPEDALLLALVWQQPS